MSQPPPPRDASGPPRRPKRVGGVVVPHAPRWYQWAAAWVVYALVRIVAATLRYRWHDGSGGFLEKHRGPAIYCVWHNRLALCLPAYFSYARPRTRTAGMAALVSASKDGGFLAAILECFGVQPVRGSSSRRGPQALLELTTWGERGYDLAITPDGPRGPRYVVQDGVMSLAQVTGLPILPFSYDLTWKICLKSWDRFQVPIPFSVCDMRIGPPLQVPRDISDGQRNALREQLQQNLRALTLD
ncbi:MAG TPA: lysophospholipid acyltransferase family protein [Verrucomicrobiota bacterium]|nr:lysophospholipid acyltransferase family protein [Verrucomicrobiota bacterium]